jgi:hypothetical protein
VGIKKYAFMYLQKRFQRIDAQQDREPKNSSALKNSQSLRMAKEKKS